MFVNDLLICCQTHAWEPRFINTESSYLTDPELDASVVKESQAALEHGKVALALDLINLALRAGRQSIELLQTKAAALQQNEQGRQSSEQSSDHVKQEVLVALRQLCINADWQPRYLPEGAAPESISAFETLVLKELEALRDEQRPEFALQLAEAALANDPDELEIFQTHASRWLFLLVARAPGNGTPAMLSWTDGTFPQRSDERAHEVNRSAPRGA